MTGKGDAMVGDPGTWTTAAWAIGTSGGLSPVAVLAQDDAGGTLLLGEDFLPWMVLALGAALVVGNVAALLRPPQGRDASERPPLVRSVVMIVVGAVAAVWGLASLLG